MGRGSESDKGTEQYPWFRLTLSILKEKGFFDNIGFIEEHRYTFNYYPSVGETLPDLDMYDGPPIYELTQEVLQVAYEFDTQDDKLPEPEDLLGWVELIQDTVDITTGLVAALGDRRDGYTHSWSPARVQDCTSTPADFAKTGNHTL